MDTQIHPDTKLVCSKQILWSELGDEIVMMNIDEGSYFSLTGPSARVWELLKDPIDTQSIQRVLIDEYDVEAQQCTQELQALIGKLRDVNLVQLVPDENG